MSSILIRGPLEFILLHLGEKGHNSRDCHRLYRNIMTQLHDEWTLLPKRDRPKQIIQTEMKVHDIGVGQQTQPTKPSR